MIENILIFLKEYVYNFLLFLSNYIHTFVGISPKLSFEITTLFLFLLESYVFFVFLKPGRFIYLYIFLKFPGTVIHEISHAIGNLILGNKVVKISLIPEIKKEKGKYNIKMGYIKSHSRYKSGTLLGSIMPLIMVPVFSLFLIHLVNNVFNIENNIVKTLIVLYILLFIFPAYSLSKQDILSYNS